MYCYLYLVVRITLLRFNFLFSLKLRDVNSLFIICRLWKWYRKCCIATHFLCRQQMIYLGLLMAVFQLLTRLRNIDLQDCKCKNWKCKWSWKEVAVACFIYYPRICLNGLKKTTRNPSKMTGIRVENRNQSSIMRSKFSRYSTAVLCKSKKIRC